MRYWRNRRRAAHNKKLVLFLAFLILGIAVFICRTKNPSPFFYEEPQVKLYLSEQKKCITLPLEEYLIGCVSAEMPALFHEEALKAQAICARTYALRKLLEGRSYPMGADLTDDPNNCQAYIDAKEFARRHPSNTQSLLNNITKAVRSTRGMVMTYKGEPIDALYHSTCGGKTESAVQVWGKDITYLQSVKCEYCKASSYYQRRQEFTWDEIKESLHLSDSEAAVKVMATTSTGRVKTVSFDQQTISGEKLRQSLNLPSLWLDLKAEKNKLIINSRGYGHGVGLCQFGANGMAQQGCDYKKILNHYYHNIDLYLLPY